MEKITAKPPKKKGKKLLYPFDTVANGEALLLTADESADKKKVNSFISAAYQYAERNGITFKRGTENGIVGIYRTH